MPRITPQQIALGVGAAGAMVDVSTYVDFAAGITSSYGKKTDFEDTPPGTFSFTLDNYDGRFIPDNPSSPLVTKLSEGVAVSWLAGTRLVSGTVRSIAPVFSDATAAWGQVQITCDDMLGEASRYELSNGTLSQNMVYGAPAYLYWPLDDAPGSVTAREASGNNAAPLSTFSGVPSAAYSTTFGVAGVPNGPTTQLQLFANNSVANLQKGVYVTGGERIPVSYPPGTMGAWGFWFTPLTDPAGFTFYWSDGQFTDNFTFACSSLASGMSFTLPGSTFAATTGALTVGVPHYFAVQVTPPATGFLTLSAKFYMDGALVGTSTGSVSSAGQSWLGPKVINVNVANAGTVTANISDLSHTAHIINEAADASPANETVWLTTLSYITGAVVLDTLPTDLSVQALGTVDYANKALLDLLNDVIRTEQGYIYTATTGSLLAPSQVVRIRSRTRPVTPAYSFNAQSELTDAPEFVRDITNMVSADTVTGSGDNNQVIVSDSSVISRVGSANSSDTILNVTYVDLLAWGQDRLNRGKNIALRAAKITVDAFTTPTDRSASLLGMTLGDRIRITSLPNTQLGFTQWDGWLLGVDETHSLSENTFEMYFAPVLPDTAIYDTNLWMNDGNNALNASITSGATTMVLKSADGVTFLDTVAVPYSMTIESEQVTVTAVTAPSGVLQTATITRAQGGTTAAAHSAGIAPDITPVSLYAF